MSEEIWYSALIGLALSIILIQFGSLTANQAAEVADKKKNDDIETKDNSGFIDDDPPSRKQPNVYINDEAVLERTKFLQNSFGISSESISKAVLETNEELRNGRQSADDSFGSFSFYSSMLDYFVFGIVFIICVYSVNMMTKGEFLKIMVGFFRTEFESINWDKVPDFIKQYIFHDDHKRY